MPPVFENTKLYLHTEGPWVEAVISADPRMSVSLVLNKLCIANVGGKYWSWHSTGATERHFDDRGVEYIAYTAPNEFDPTKELKGG